MKRPYYLFCLLTFVLFLSGLDRASAQNEFSENVRNERAKIKVYTEKLISIVKNYSAFSDSLNWQNIENELALKSDKLTSLSEANELANYLIGQLKSVGDKHSFLRTKSQIKNLANGTIINEKPYSILISEHIAMIKVPAMIVSSSKIKKEFAQTIQDMIRKFDSEHVINGWIIDLKNNYGGDMYPMIAGIGPLTGSGKLGYFVHHTSDKVKYKPWFYKKGLSGLGNNVFVKIDRPYRLKNTKFKIAVLINRHTSSAGEMTAISFSGAKNVRFFGEPSGGFTTGTQSFTLSDGTDFFLAMTFSADRTKKIFKGQIIPHQLVEVGDENANIEAATKWLKEGQ